LAAEEIGYPNAGCYGSFAASIISTVDFNRRSAQTRTDRSSIADGCPWSAPATQRVSKAGVSRELALCIQVTLALITVIVTPLILSLFEAGFPNASDFRFNDIWGIMKTVALVQFLPLGIGFAIHQIQAEWVEKLAKILNKLSQVLLLILVLAFAIFIITSKLLLSLGWTTFFIIALFNILLLAMGHFLAAGSTKEFQTSVAISAIARNLGLAIFIAASIGRADAVLTIFAAQIIGIIVNFPYTQWIKRS
jgi:predicted Na+-dependent transporter